MVQAVIFLVFPLCLVFAAITDFLEMTIPNRISLVLAGAFFAIAPFVGLGWTEFGLHIVAALSVFCVCFALFAVNVMGGGDGKLLTAAALWFGFDPSLVSFLIYVAYIGGILTILLLVVRSRASTVLAMGLPLPDSIVMAKKVPYAIAIAAGGMLAFAHSPLLNWALAASS